MTYVWFDALATTTATGYVDDPDGLKVMSGIHLIGKDILRNHCVYWPAVMSAGLQPLTRSRAWLLTGGRRENVQNAIKSDLSF